MDYITGPDHDKQMITVDLPEKSNLHILVSLSGGADSAIMLYLIAKQNRDFVLQISFVATIDFLYHLDQLCHII